jgi:hypothetical protein
MSLWMMFDSTCSAYRPAVGKGALDGVQQDFTPGDPGVIVVLSNAACSYQPAKGSIKQFYQQRDQDCDGQLLFAQDPGDLVNCLIVLTRGRIGDVLNLLALGTGDPIQMGQTWVWPVDVQRVRQPQ